MDEITLKALAKINLGLDVVRRRADGYHEVKMIMQTIHLYDRLEIKRTEQPGIHIETNLSFLPVDESNLVYKAAELLMKEFGIKDGIEVHLLKRIPVAAGLAGGSTDGAAMLYGMNRLFHLNLSRRELMERGVKLGADVPYCIMRGTALAEGIGEKLTPIAPMVKCFVLIAKPPVFVSTKMVYRNLKLGDETIHPDMDALQRAIESQDMDQICRNMGNLLETVTIPMYPVIDRIKDCMLAEGAKAAMMSGSGPTVFGLFTDETMAKNARERLRELGMAKQMYLTSIYNNRRKQDLEGKYD